MREIDAGWRAEHPLTVPEGGTDKDERGRVLVVGGAARVPGAIALTAEAALRIGAGKVQMATIRSAALPLGIRFPEAAVVALPEDDAGEIADEPADALLAAIARADVAVLGPGMGDRDAAARLVTRVAGCGQEVPLVLDAVAVACAQTLEEALRPCGNRLVMTPHTGEMAALLGCDEEKVEADPAAIAAGTARRFGAVVVLKGPQTVIAAPDGTTLHYAGGGPGLGTGGSGDVLAGVIGGLIARGLPLLDAAGWGVWLHGEAGRVLAAEVGPIGFLGRELLPVLPRLLPR